MEQSFVNGPINAARLEGMIGNVKKVVYLFMDRHEPLESQTKCTNLFSKDISQFLLDSMLEIQDVDTSYDFFIEITPTSIYRTVRNTKPYEPRNNYINEVGTLFAKLMSYDKAKNTVSHFLEIPNVRLHFMDIRDYFEDVLYYTFLKLESEVEAENYAKAKVSAKKLASALKIVIAILQNPKQTKALVLQTPQKYVLSPNVINYIAHKMRYKYSNPEIKAHMNNLLDSYIEDVQRAFDHITALIDSLEQKRYPTGLATIMSIIFYEFFVKITDIFFFRRILDKDYITNIIAYTGWLHSDNYMQVLVRDYGFKITHITVSNMSVDRANVIAQTTGFGSLLDEFGQCVDMSKFPERFL